MLRANKKDGTIIIDNITTLAGIPPAAWKYMLGSRSAIEWILDQYKYKTPKDPTIRNSFDTYSFDVNKEHVIELIAKIVRVSMETVDIIGRMGNEVATPSS